MFDRGLRDTMLWWKDFPKMLMVFFLLKAFICIFSMFIHMHIYISLILILNPNPDVFAEIESLSCLPWGIFLSFFFLSLELLAQDLTTCSHMLTRSVFAMHKYCLDWGENRLALNYQGCISIWCPCCVTGKQFFPRNCLPNDFEIVLGKNHELHADI